MLWLQHALASSGYSIRDVLIDKKRRDGQTDRLESVAVPCFCFQRETVASGDLQYESLVCGRRVGSQREMNGRASIFAGGSEK